MSWSSPPSHEPEQHGFYDKGQKDEKARSMRHDDFSHPPPVLPPPSQLLGPSRQLPPLSDLPVFSRATSATAPMPPSATPEPSSMLPTIATPVRLKHPDIPPPQSSIAQQSQTNKEFPFPHPTLFAQRASYQSKNPGTVFEALSPVDYGSDMRSFHPRDDSQSPNQYPPGPVSSFQRPTSSQTGAARSSSAASLRGPAGPVHGSSVAAQPVMQLPPAPTSVYDRFILQIRQQPLAARACGHGERDRRVIDPPPIIQLTLDMFDPTSKVDQTEIQYPFNIMHCALLAVPPSNQAPQQSTSSTSPYDANASVSPMSDPNQTDRISRRLMGTLVASPFVAIDPDAPESSNPHSKLSTFFCFPDLSCRQNGRYKLRFTLMKVPMGPEAGFEGAQQQGSVYGSVDSDEFQVHSAKGFPGMTASSRLIKELKKQGLAVPIRKGKDRGRERERDAEKRSGQVNVSVSGSGSQDDDDEDNTSNERAQKRRG